MAKTKGTVAQFGPKGFGFIDGDDGEKYFVHQKNIVNKARLKTNARVVFKTKESEKGLVAFDVEPEDGVRSSAPSKPFSAGTIKALFLVSFVIQAALIYKIFFTG
jgi:CspA family cold shock protein